MWGLGESVHMNNQKVGLINQAPTINMRFHFLGKVGLMNQIPSIEKKYNRNYSCFAGLTP